MVEKIHELTDQPMAWQETTEVVGQFNRMLRGWANYFRSGPSASAYRAVDGYTAPRLRRWLCRKHKVQATRGRDAIHPRTCTGTWVWCD